MSITPAVVTGVGPVTAIGSGRNAFWDALVDGQHGFGPVTLCDVSKSPSKIAAEVKDFDLETYVVKGGVMARHTPRAVSLGLAASVLALHDAEIDLDACDPDRLGVFVGTWSGTSAKSSSYIASSKRRASNQRRTRPSTPSITRRRASSPRRTSYLPPGE